MMKSCSTINADFMLFMMNLLMHLAVKTRYSASR